MEKVNNQYSWLTLFQSLTAAYLIVSLSFMYWVVRGVLTGNICVSWLLKSTCDYCAFFYIMYMYYIIIIILLVIIIIIIIID